ncbi:MAG: RNA polymerase sigma factor [Armatimonadetes bacterium]|nr:RNA polymerase sigma factor [Armatimonadota bacterium]
MTYATNDCFETMTKKMYSRVYSFALKLTRNTQDAADLSQETFLRAYKARDRRLPDREPDAWLFRIAYRCFLDKRRMMRRRPETVSVEVLCAENYTYDPVDPGPSPEQEFFKDKLSEPMMAALGALTEDQRELIRLADFGGLSYNELAEVFGCAASVIKTRVHRAHVALRRNLLRAGFEVPKSLRVINA